MKKYLGNYLEISENNITASNCSNVFTCKVCKIKYVHKWKDDEKWRYIPNVKTGPVWLELTCEEMIIKNLLE